MQTTLRSVLRVGNRWRERGTKCIEGENVKVEDFRITEVNTKQWTVQNTAGRVERVQTNVRGDL